MTLCLRYDSEPAAGSGHAETLARLHTRRRPLRSSSHGRSLAVQGDAAGGAGRARGNSPEIVTTISALNDLGIAIATQSLFTDGPTNNQPREIPQDRQRRSIPINVRTLGPHDVHAQIRLLVEHFTEVFNLANESRIVTVDVLWHSTAFNIPGS